MKIPYRCQFFLTFTFCISLNAMEPQLNKCQVLVNQLPYLDVATPLHPRLEPNWWTSYHQQWYQMAFTPQMPTSQVLAWLSTPYNYTYEDIQDGVPVDRHVSYTFALANLARGVMAHTQNNTDQARIQLTQARDRVGYKLHEEPVRHAANAALALLDKKLDVAFEYIKQLVHTKADSSWQQFALAQLRVLGEKEHMAAKAIVHAFDQGNFKTKETKELFQLLVTCDGKDITQTKLYSDKKTLRALRALAQSNNVVASNILARVAFAQALSGKNMLGTNPNNESKVVLLEMVKPYAEHAKHLPGQRAYHHALLSFLDAAIHVENNKLADASKKLVPLVDQESDNADVQHMQQLGRQLLTSLVYKDDWRSRCWHAAKQLKRETVKKRRDGIALAQVMLDVVTQHEPNGYEALLHEFDIVKILNETTDRNKGPAQAALAIYACDKAAQSQDIFGKSLEREVVLQEAKNSIEIAQEITRLDRARLRLLKQYVDGAIAYEHHDPHTASTLLCDLQETNNASLTPAIRIHVQEMLMQMAQTDNIIARTWHAQKTEDPQLACAIIEQFVDDQTHDVALARNAQSLFTIIKTAAQTGDPRANYLYSRFLFKTVHTPPPHRPGASKDTSSAMVGDIVQMDPSLATQLALSGPCKAIMIATKANYPGAREYARALMTYSGCLKMLTAGNNDAAVDQLLRLQECNDIPEADRPLFTAFAESQLGRLAREGHIPAVCWRASQLLSSSDQDNIAQGMDLSIELVQYLWQKFEDESPPKHIEALAACGLVAKLTELSKTTQSNEIFCSLYTILSGYYRLQAGMNQRFIDHELPGQDRVHAQLHYAVTLAQKAYQQCSMQQKARCSKAYGSALYQLAMYCKEYCDDTETMLKFLEQGAVIEHPASLRSFALYHLMIPPDKKKMDQKTFMKYFKQLVRAYELGDQRAGALLAERYAKGNEKGFACGYALPKDITKAYQIAQTVQLDLPHLQRIRGFVEYKLLSEKKFIKRSALTRMLDQSIALLMSAAKQEDEDAFYYLMQIANGNLAAAHQVQRIFDFFGQQAQQGSAIALCAVGSKYLDDPHISRKEDNIDKAVACFKKAMHISNGLRGHHMFALLYSLPVYGKVDVVKATHHCYEMLEGMDREGYINTSFLEIMSRVLQALEAEGSQKSVNAIKRLRQKADQIGILVMKDQSKETDLLQKNKHTTELILDNLKRVQDNELGIANLGFQCLKYEIYPEAVLSFLTQLDDEGNTEALRALAAIEMLQGDKAKGLAMIDRAIEAGDTIALIEQAFMLAKFFADDLDRLEGIPDCMQRGFGELLPEQRHDFSIINFIPQTLGLLVRLCDEARINSNQKRIIRIAAIVQRIMSLIKEHDITIASTFDNYVLFASAHFACRGDYDCAIEYIAKALSVMQADNSDEQEMIQEAVQSIFMGITQEIKKALAAKDTKRKKKVEGQLIRLTEILKQNGSEVEIQIIKSGSK